MQNKEANQLLALREIGELAAQLIPHVVFGSQQQHVAQHRVSRLEQAIGRLKELFSA